METWSFHKNKKAQLPTHSPYMDKKVHTIYFVSCDSFDQSSLIQSVNTWYTQHLLTFFANIKYSTFINS